MKISVSTNSAGVQPCSPYVELTPKELSVVLY
jgi:hypothetical protein